jgi:hypothetical protein
MPIHVPTRLDRMLAVVAALISEPPALAAAA